MDGRIEGIMIVGGIGNERRFWESFFNTIESWAIDFKKNNSSRFFVKNIFDLKLVLQNDIFNKKIKKSQKT